MTRQASLRNVLLVLLALSAWLAGGVATAGPAAAHATLVATDPGEGARLESAPAEVTLEFSEGVSLGAGYARVLTADGDQVAGDDASVDGRVLGIPLPADVDDGGYLVTYRVVSADSHPISGAFSFVVGDGDLVPVGSTAGDADADPVVAAVLPVVRALGFAGIALAVGIPVLALLCWPTGWASARLRRLAVGGALLAAGTALLAFLLQGPYTSGGGPGALFDPELLSSTASSGTGWSLLARAALALALAAALAPAWRRGRAPGTPQLAAAAVFAIGLVVATAAIGHPVAGSWPVLAVAVAAVHVAAMSVWLGGLAGLLIGLLRPAPDADDVARAMSRFSRVAFGAVVALVVSGVVQAVREVATPSALVGNTYGGVLLAKIAVVLVVLGAAGVSRVWVQQRLGVRRPRPGGVRRVTAQAFAAPTGADDRPDDEDGTAVSRGRAQSENAVAHLPSLRRSMLVEVAGAVVVLVLSAVLVGTPPARATVAQPIDVLLPLQGTGGEVGSVQVSVAPGKVGPNELRLYLFDDQGRLTQPADIGVSLTEPSQDIGPLDVQLRPAGPGHYLAEAMPVPNAGTWTLTVTVRLDEFTATTASTDLKVR
ncbi:FixH family protein [Candidatus Blastococcus massiliensis]|uniref:copper resistance CopC/CopD family protein n=1 Tax=Candidatus Blastococcus massiliensis TaxID=1470358 RepID=UPI0004B9B1B7|nr:FixH family protein [Candidatus Blastococcus massiliensis]